MNDIKDLIDRLSDHQRREFALFCAGRVRHLMTDARSTAALDVAARHLRGEATDEELVAARNEAFAAAWDAPEDASMSPQAEEAAWAAEKAARVPILVSDASGIMLRVADALKKAEHAAHRTELERMLGRAAGAEEVKP